MKNLDIIPLDLYNIEFLINQGMYLLEIKVYWNNFILKLQKKSGNNVPDKKKVGAGKEIK